MDNSFNPFISPDVPPNQQYQPKSSAPYIKPTVQTNIIDDYEPFNNQPAILQTDINTQPKVPPKISAENLEKLHKDLEDRSRRLAEEEERLHSLDSQANNKNFPPFPHCCPLKSCFYQAIDVEIPEPYRLIVRCTFYLWLAYSLTLFINIFGTMSYMIIYQLKDDSGALFGVSILYFFLFVPSSYVLWFRPLYKAFKNNSSFNFFLFFIIFGAQIIVLIIQVLGIKVLGSCGWIVSVSALSLNIGVMGFMIFIAILLTLELICSFFIIIRVNMHFRSSGGSIQKAKEELRNDTSSSSTVRSAAFGALSNTN